MSLERLTLGELRRALANGLSEETVGEALARLGQADKQAAEHGRTVAGYHRYVERRQERFRNAVIEAVDEVDRAQERTGQPWPSPEVRAEARHAAGWQAQDDFLDSEPLLEFGDWVDAGKPARYRATTDAAKRHARLDRLLRGGR